jgi:uncharacterized membrane protein HdeD (DUF308 family)
MVQRVSSFEVLRAHWWALLIRGIVAILFGFACFALTGAALLLLVFWIGAFFIVDGALMVASAVRSVRTSSLGHWIWQLLGGLAGIAFGLLTFLWPGITALLLAGFVAAWAILTGVFELVTAVRMRAVIPNEWLWVVNGVLSILLGLAILAFPGAGLVGLVWLIGFYAFLAGITMIALSLRMRKSRIGATTI